MTVAIVEALAGMGSELLGIERSLCRLPAGSDNLLPRALAELLVDPAISLAEQLAQLMEPGGADKTLPADGESVHMAPEPYAADAVARAEMPGVDQPNPSPSGWAAPAAHVSQPSSPLLGRRRGRPSVGSPVRVPNDATALLGASADTWASRLVPLARSGAEQAIDPHRPMTRGAPAAGNPAHEAYLPPVPPSAWPAVTTTLGMSNLATAQSHIAMAVANAATSGGLAPQTEPYAPYSTAAAAVPPWPISTSDNRNSSAAGSETGSVAEASPNTGVSLERGARGTDVPSVPSSMPPGALRLVPGAGSLASLLRGGAAAVQGPALVGGDTDTTMDDAWQGVPKIEPVEISTAPPRDNPLDIEHVLAALSDQLELEFIRTYGTSGG